MKGNGMTKYTVEPTLIINVNDVMSFKKKEKNTC